MANTAVVAFDTANEVIALGLGILDSSTQSITLVAEESIAAHRASNTQLIPRLDALLEREGVTRDEIGCIVCGRGPGSFTGVRIALATAKGMAQALGVALVGVSSLDAVAWNAWSQGVRGDMLVAADAMRHEVYPVRFSLDDRGVARLETDRVVKVESAVAEAESVSGHLQVTGDALTKYAALFESFDLLPDPMRTSTGKGLLLAAEAAWKDGAIDPTDARRHNPAFLLPVYTRLSDAEENERARLSLDEARNLTSGVQGMGVVPLQRSRCRDVAALEAQIMGSDAWSENSVADELPRKDRSWWCALIDDELIGYAGGWVVDGQLQILKVGTHPTWRQKGIARLLLAHVADDARNLGASTATLEVRERNEGAQAFYRALHFHEVGVRPHYYSDGENALIMDGPLPLSDADVAGMRLTTGWDASPSAAAPPMQENEPVVLPAPRILALETSCDETAAALIDGEGRLHADIVASQVDFHARFGGVVPEIASRKHIEAICGVAEECLERAGQTWGSLDAVAVTYAPGLVGALVVGVAFVKGASWALNVPCVAVNHLEGHLYANKLGDPDFTPPAVVSLVSGGNTMLVHMKDWGDYETLGATIDDAVGEAFDKVAKALGLGYPGGPVISRFAAEGNPDAIAFPRAMLHSGDLRFSLSGLKTAVVTYINAEREAGRPLNVPDICASFQQAVIDVQIAKAETALKDTGAPTFCLGGGVAANPALRRAYEELCARLHVKLVMPPLFSCGDNAGMIALVALDRYTAGKFMAFDGDAYAHADLDKPY